MVHASTQCHISFTFSMNPPISSSERHVHSLFDFTFRVSDGNGKAVTQMLHPSSPVQVKLQTGKQESEGSNELQDRRCGGGLAPPSGLGDLK